MTVFESPEDAHTMRNIGINVAALVGVTLTLIALSLLIG